MRGREEEGADWGRGGARRRTGAPAMAEKHQQEG